MYIKIEHFLESEKPTLKKLLNDYDLKDTYGYYEISDSKEILTKLKKDIEENHKKEYDKLKLEDNKLIIFKKDVKYDCVMLSSDIDKKDWNDFLKIIDEKDLYLGETQKDIDDDEYGLESEPHITLLYGIHPKENDKAEILDWLKTLKPIKLELSKIGIFENEKYDVVKIEVEPTEQLLKYRKYIEETFENTQTFDEYNPHMTLGYVKSGKGKKYVQTLEKKLKLFFNEVIYSDSSYKKEYIKLK
ncbi:2'-5' RNA ligase family protein [Candidatus Dojkabacteria bacterium]|jgi:2'-5' RNA ligase|nr:2'-5' RNA ligase family protein [Candidatus Dojkabacteria bacterium]